MRWARALPQRVRRTIRTTYVVEDVGEGPTMSGTRSARPVGMVPPADYASTTGLTRRSMAFECVASSFSSMSSSIVSVGSSLHCKKPYTSVSLTNLEEVTTSRCSY